MSGIVLSASVRQNLLSLQSTAELLATTQNRLSTGKKVNTALDNPTNYFTAAAPANPPTTSPVSPICGLCSGPGLAFTGVRRTHSPFTGSSSQTLLANPGKQYNNVIKHITTAGKDS